MAIKYPTDCDLPSKRTEYLYRAQELLRELHNYFSAWLHEGKLTETQHKNLPKTISTKYPHESKLSERDLKKFMDEDFTPRSDKICQEICVQRALLKSSSIWSIDIGEI